MNTQEQVRQFYDKVGWQVVEDGNYQNARYEDLRPVARDYVHRCHLRVNRFLNPTGKLILDAGSGPVQYPEYLTYSAGYDFRVCVDISICPTCPLEMNPLTGWSRCIPCTTSPRPGRKRLTANFTDFLRMGLKGWWSTAGLNHA